jgi:Leucine-rich repeat (LRR) protein
MIRSLVFVLSACCCSLLLSSSLAEAAVTCPPIEFYSPCECTEWTGTGTIRLSCFARNLTDSKATEILQVFLTTPEVSPVGILKLDRNLLTRIPDEIHQFPQLVRVQLDSNNITSIDTAGTFKFTSTAPLQLLMLYNTQLTTIAPGAFQGF